MLTVIGNHFPTLVIISMALFAVTLAGFSIEDAVKGRHRP